MCLTGFVRFVVERNIIIRVMLLDVQHMSPYVQLWNMLFSSSFFTVCSTLPNVCLQVSARFVEYCFFYTCYHFSGIISGTCSLLFHTKHHSIILWLVSE
jgi:ABC-type multidrug transport system permease subunit